MRRIAALAVAVAAVALRVHAGEHPQPADKKAETKEHPAPSAVHVMLTPDKVQWGEAPAALPKGAQAVVLEGDPKKEGYFAMRLKLPAGYRIQAHFHPVQERVTVIEGTFRLGMGDKFDEAALKEYPAGSYTSMPAGTRHFAYFKDGGVIQLSTIGPWGITYVNPADDPRNQKAQR